MSELSDMYPDGRTFYYEGEDIEGFVKLARSKGWELFVSFEVPASDVAEVYRRKLPVGT